MSITAFRSRWLIILAALLVLLFFSETLVHFLTESWWFQAVGYGKVFWTRLRWQGAIALLSFCAWWGVLYFNYRIAQHLTRHRLMSVSQNREWDPYLPGIVKGISLGLITMLSVGAAISGVARWEAVLKFLNPVPFGTADPLYGQDISFYIFQLPLYEILRNGTLELLIWSLVIAVAIYALKGEIRPERGWKYFLTGEVKTHLCILLALLATVAALGFWVARFELLYSPTGVVYGAGYTDVNARMAAYGILGFITVVVGILFLVSVRRGGFSLPLAAIGVYAVAALLLAGLYPWFQQSFVVEPTELEKETPYIEHSIAFTRAAYGLDIVQTEDFAVQAELDRAALDENRATLDNIRLWDYRPLRTTYSSLQTLRPYYRFRDVDIDRYRVDDDYRQVMLSPRELRTRSLPETAQTWVNQHLIYTHGYGLAMSPVNQVTREGLPEFWIKDLPPQTSVDIAVDQPRIYYGEETSDYIVTGTRQPEFDYPLGDENANYEYSGAGGVALGGMRRLAYAYDLGAMPLLLSSYVTPNSRIQYHRTVRDRVAQLAPFLSLDSDPYLALIDGRMQWIVDAYTTSNRYPYSQPLRRSRGDGSQFNEAIRRIAGAGTNYIRDAVKVVVDAYDGTVTLYVADTNDPILASYQQIFPSLFTPMDAASEALKAHFRYPLNLFKIQAQMYLAYHIQRPEVFYNQEDLWAFPTQVSQEESADVVEPYYVIMKLPDSDREEFLLILPYTPVGKNNMVAWMAARCDGDSYGELVLYEFSRQALIYGPRQIDTRIDQDPEISQQLTLWNQEGSEVFRGDLLVIPVNQSLLYVEPIYLQAKGAGEGGGRNGGIPELKRVIVSYDDAIVMETTLEDALNQIFGEVSERPEPSPTAPPSAPSSDAENTADAPPEAALPEAAPPVSSIRNQQIEAALQAYQDSQTALKAGDWEAYGEAQARLGQLLEALDGEPQ
ncbi:MAG: UPF0182 family protein [Cyanobacteria bacterium P01_A01_bin.105]